MTKHATETRAQVGDLLVIEGHHVGEARRTGEILAVLGEPGHVHYRVRWDDGRESVCYPGSDATIQPKRAPAAPRRGGRAR